MLVSSSANELSHKCLYLPKHSRVRTIYPKGTEWHTYLRKVKRIQPHRVSRFFLTFHLGACAAARLEHVYQRSKLSIMLIISCDLVRLIDLGDWGEGLRCVARKRPRRTDCTLINALFVQIKGADKRS